MPHILPSTSNTTSTESQHLKLSSLQQTVIYEGPDSAVGTQYNVKMDKNKSDNPTGLNSVQESGNRCFILSVYRKSGTNKNRTYHSRNLYNNQLKDVGILVHKSIV